MIVFEALSNKFLSFIRKNKFKYSIIMLPLSQYFFLTTSVMCTGYPQLDLKIPVCTTVCDEHNKAAFDVCTFTCEVLLSNPLLKDYVFSFQKSKHLSNDFISEEKLHLLSDCDDSTNCNNVSDHRIQIEMNFTANTENRGAKIRCVLYPVNVTSHTRLIPDTSDFKYFSRNLTINGHGGLTESNCSMDVTDNHINLQFDCKPTLCVINMSVNDQTPSQHTGRINNMRLDLRNGEDMNISLKYAPCSLDQNYSTIKCRVKSESNVSEQSNSNSLLWSPKKISIVTILSVLVVVGAIIGLIFFIRNRRPCQERNIEQHTGLRSSTYRVGDVDKVVGHQENSPETLPLQEIDGSVKHQQDPVYIVSSGGRNI